MLRNPFDTVPSPFVAALLHPLNLAVLALAAAAGLCSWWVFFPLGLLLWGIMFLLVYRDPALRLRHTVQQRTSLTKRFQERFDRVERSQVAVFNALTSAKPNVRRALQPVQDAIGQLTDRAYSLCVRMTALENHRLVTQANRNPADDLAQVEQKIAATSDPMVKREYEETRRALQVRIANMQAITVLLDRSDAQLTSLSSALDELQTDIIRVQILDVKAIRTELPGLLAKIRTQMVQLREFEEQAAHSKV